MTHQTLRANNFMPMWLYSQAPGGNLVRDCDSPLQTNTAITSTVKSRNHIAVISSPQMNTLNLSVDQNLDIFKIRLT